MNAKRIRKQQNKMDFSACIGHVLFAPFSPINKRGKMSKNQDYIPTNHHRRG
ncbi:MAG: hypothetical protein ACXAEU_00805 [Candidatus Hodarchaeales archaeon]